MHQKTVSMLVLLSILSPAQSFGGTTEEEEISTISSPSPRTPVKENTLSHLKGWSPPLSLKIRQKTEKILDRLDSLSPKATEKERVTKVLDWLDTHY